MKLRLEGTEAECAACLEQLRIVFHIVNTKGPYSSRRTGRNTVRMYVEVLDKASAAAAAPRQARPVVRRRGKRPDASREARRLAKELAARFGCQPGTLPHAVQLTA